MQVIIVCTVGTILTRQVVYTGGLYKRHAGFIVTFYNVMLLYITAVMMLDEGWEEVLCSNSSLHTNTPDNPPDIIAWGHITNRRRKSGTSS